MTMLPNHGSVNRLILIRRFYLTLFSMPNNGNINAMPFHVVFTFREEVGLTQQSLYGEFDSAKRSSP